MGWHRDRCRTKRAYEAPGEARRALRRMRRQGVADPSLRAYRCCFCAMWHLGTKPSMETLEQLAAEVRGLE